ncbi:MAG: hypothetical protein RLZ32_1302 [Gemmatimonadota bacterium]|jgi:acetyl esterase/lipase
MSSLPARLFSALIRIGMRRRSWGPPHRLVRRARVLMGTQPWWQALASRGVRITPVAGVAPDGTPVRGEWLEPPAPGAGVVLYIHGGGFVACSAATHRPITAGLARATGCRVFSLEYRLAPEHPFPAAPDDALAAWRWLRAQGIPADHLALGGESAGGNLALGLAQRLRDLGEALPAAVVAFSAWTDLAATGASRTGNDGRDAMFRPDNPPDFAACYLPAGVTAADPRVSPLYAGWQGLPPLYLEVGAEELLLDDSVRVHEAVRSAGGDSALVVRPGLPHAWPILAPFVPEATQSLRDAGAFLRRRLDAAR